MFGLETGILILLIVCLFFACVFEFVNGFHDTANAVATVIYTNSLKPMQAVAWSGFCNFVGVFAGGTAVAMGIVNLLPVEVLIDQNVSHSIAMVLALLFSAILWNVGTWYFGLPSSSTHTLVGSILGVGIAFQFMPDNTTGAAVNWSKAEEMGLSLVFSPLFGFTAALGIMWLMVKFFGPKNEIFQEPIKDSPPPRWIRTILILTCTSVSFFHGSNDGQKGVGLMMLILIGIVPAWFSLNTELDIKTLQQPHAEITALFNRNAEALKPQQDQVNEITPLLNELAATVQHHPGHHSLGSDFGAKDNFIIRKDILLISKKTETLLKTDELSLPEEERKQLKASLKILKAHTDYAPFWVTLMISLSLGLGTMVGWKRIVVTIGEKIGKSHLSYAQGAGAEIIAASTIGVSSGLGLPVSTTHVLSSGIAGAMVSGKGLANLQKGTVRNIAIAWLLTLPVSMFLAGSLFLLFRAIM